MGWFDHSHLPKVPVDDIVQNSSIRNIRQTRSEAAIVELATGIYKEGLMNPICILETEDEDGEPLMELVAGSRRTAAIQYIIKNIDEDFMKEGVPYTPYMGEVANAVFANALENLDREDLNVVDVCEYLAERVDEGHTTAELAKHLNRSESWVHQRVFFWSNACDKLKHAARGELLSWAAACALAKKSAAEQEKFLNANERWMGKVTAEDVVVSGDDDRVARPGKAARAKLLGRLEALIEKGSSDVCLGMTYVLRWADGLLTDAEIDEILEQEAPPSKDDTGGT